MLAAVQPTSSGFGGGVYAPAGRPTGVGGSLGAPGTTASTPAGVPTSGVIEARNNRGTNVLVPYARLVPMHGRSNPHAKDPKDERTLVIDGHSQLEYDGLRGARLAWVLGRRFKAAQGNNLEALTQTATFANMANGGLGNGVDRMQRLCDTQWVEHVFAQKLGDLNIDLHTIRLDSAYAKATSSALADAAHYLAGATALVCPDVAWWGATITQDSDALKAVGANPANAAQNGPTNGRRLQGLNVLDTGPFLRGMQVDSSIVRFKGKGVFSKDMGRNMGDMLAFAALDSEIRRRNLMDWTPDGIVLSKLESPTDEPLASTYLDAQQAQLFNVGIQGPAITTAWTSDVRDHKLQVQPMDKVFVCIVARVSNRFTQSTNAAYVALRTAQDAVRQAHRQAVADSSATMLEAFSNAKNAASAACDDYLAALASADEKPKFVTLKNAVKQAKLNYAAASGDAAAGLKQELDEAEAALAEATVPMKTESQRSTFNNLATNMRKGRLAVSQSTLSNFRLMRTTSSHLANYSFLRPGVDSSRLGLPLSAFQGSAGGDFSTTGEYIIGGWCIGTVVDSAASRATIHGHTTTSATSMAINVSVDIKWWSADELYKKYMDVGGTVTQRGQDTTTPKQATVAAEGGADALPGQFRQPISGSAADDFQGFPELDALNESADIAAAPEVRRREPERPAAPERPAVRQRRA